MNAAATFNTEMLRPVEVGRRSPWWQWKLKTENYFLVAALLVMVALPVVEIVLRTFFQTGISGSSAIEQHLTLIVGMMGGAIAARDGRLLGLSTGQTCLRGRWKHLSQVVNASTAAAVSFLLGLASLRFAIAMRPLGKILVYDLPVWVIQLFLPVGFWLIAIRLILRSSPRWRSRFAVTAWSAATVCIFAWAPWPREQMMIYAFALLGLATLLGAPIFTTIGGIALILFWGRGAPLESVPLKHYSLTTNDTLPSIPLFTLAGYFLAESGASRRLVGLFQALVGHVRGGPAVVTALTCALFTSFTGASGVTILALGGVLMPVLIAARYPERSALGILTGAGSLGMLFPPCLPLILYAIIANRGGQANITIKQMFLGGIGPGIVLTLITIWWGMRQEPREISARSPFRWSELKSAMWLAKWEILIPAVAIGSLFCVPTTVEAAALTASYAFVVSVVIHRDLHPLRQLPGVVTECGLLVGGVLLILGVALGLTHALVDAEIPDRLVDWATASIHSKWLFLLGLNGVLLVVGGFIEIYAAIVVVVPLLVPLGVAFGIDPIHLGVIFLSNMELGFLLPPIGLNLLLSSYRFERPLAEVARATLPMLIVLFVGVLLITYVPALTTFLPHLFP